MGLGAREIFVCLPVFFPFEAWFGETDVGCDVGRPSEVIYPPRTNPDGTPRRRSSVFSISPGTSPDGKRASLMDFFKRKGSVSEAPTEPTVEEGVAFSKVDFEGKKEG